MTVRLPKFVKVCSLQHVLSVINVRESYEKNDAEKEYSHERSKSAKDYASWSSKVQLESSVFDAHR